jgi:hypothetical protein
MDTAITKVDDKWLKENAKVGLEEIAPADLPVPRLTLVQRTSQKAILRDGNMAKPGTFYYSATKEATEKFACAFLNVKITTNRKYSAKRDSTNPEDFEKVWNFLGVREPDWKPFIFSCRGTSAAAARNFIGNVVASGYPMFSYKVKLESRYIESEKGNFYVIAFSDVGVRDEKDQLMTLKELADKYGVAKIVEGDEEEEEAKTAPTATVVGSEDVNPDDIPF